MPSGLKDVLQDAVTARVKRAVLATLVTFATGAVMGSGFAGAIDAGLLQFWFALRGAREAPQSVAIVRYERAEPDKMVQSTGESAPLLQLARAVDAAREAGAKMIMLDFVFDQECLTGIAELAQSLAKAPSVVGMYSTSVMAAGRNLSSDNRFTVVGPSDKVRDSARMLMKVEVRTENGVARHIALYDDFGSDASMSVPLLRPLRHFVDQNLAKPGGGDFINYYGPHLSIPSISLTETVSSKEAAKAMLEGRVVFIGEHGLPTPQLGPEHDTHLTSASAEPLYGVEIHASVAANLLDGSWIRKPPSWLESLVTGLSAWVLTFVVASVGFMRGVALIGVIGGAWLAASYSSFIVFQFFLPGFVLFAVIMPVVLLLRWFWSLSSYLRCRRWSPA